jgi:hypothetical protein
MVAVYIGHTCEIQDRMNCNMTKLYVKTLFGAALIQNHKVTSNEFKNNRRYIVPLIAKRSINIR